MNKPSETTAQESEITMLRLSEQICFPIYTLSKKITNCYRPLLKALDLTYPQYLVMLVLWENDTQTVGNLCHLLHLDTGTLTPLLKRLEAKHYITRNRSDNDERIVHIALTQKGKQLSAKANKVPEALFRQVNESTDFSNEEKALLKTIADKLCKMD